MGNELTTEDQNAWNLWSETRDADAGNVLIKKYMPLVSFHVQRISVGLPRSVSKEELNSLGLMGLYDALKKFDPKRDLKFDTYASFRIRGSIIDGLRKEDWLSRGTREKSKKIEAAIEKLEQQKMRNITIEEVASELDLTPEEVYTTMNEHFFANVLSIDEQLNDQEEKEGSTYAIRDDKTAIPEEKIVKDELIKEMVEMIEQLNEKEQLVISLFYKEELTLTEIGQVMNLSTSRISQIHSKAIYRLRQSLEKII
ncbi:FliA/WhiG family RNA polymerase sigma factor [Niallia sp. NCCP-28]|uniref:FliA/WhiG family RNA polymerase sigma factor n=1 Tax=Niallia sp. NCCP-28 TaxID=2934712 RepID=UPI002082D98E|nr:FliA/WhiG family RNA polymerase sigma factor [Niallia sp. NCCP-28]GKU82496.1 RNA polymerase sigma-D factor [Niallia sp. NCCP-28]